MDLSDTTHPDQASLINDARPFLFPVTLDAASKEAKMAS